MTTSIPIEVNDLHAWYGESHVLQGVSFNAQSGEVITILGRNGAGKTTTLRSIMGMLPQRQGSIRIHGQESITLPDYRIARLGIGYCPEERAIFRSLSVRENLMLPLRVGASALSVEDILTLFPNLQERWSSGGGNLSGGEQQMLAIGRILRTGASLILLDEPTEGLAPVIVQQIGAAIRALKERGFTIILVEQNFRFAMTVADRHFVMENGQVVDQLSNAEARQQTERLRQALGV